ncbi:MAG: AI-2E family transporter [Thermoleophilia bacterium]|nr:AI-2E family transporter [Thermoleophilia bacterium]
MGDRPRTLAVTITTRTLLVGALVVFLGAAAVTVRHALLIVFLGIFLGLVFEAPTRFLMRRTGLGRGLAATIVVLGSVVLLCILGFLLLKPLLESMREFLKELPDTVAKLRDSDELGWLGDTTAGTSTQDAAGRVADSIPDALSGLVGLAGDLFSAGLAAFTLIFVALFFITDAPNLQRTVASVLPPREGDRATHLWERSANTVSRWAIGAGSIALIAGTVQGGTAWLLGSSYALALGVIAGFLDLIPNLGATIAGFILTVVLLAEKGLTAAVIMLVVVLVYPQVENSLLTPTIQGKATNISAFFVITSVTVFGALLGVVGALIAVPLTASLQIIVSEFTKDRRERYQAMRDAAGGDDPPLPAT